MVFSRDLVIPIHKNPEISDAVINAYIPPLNSGIIRISGGVRCIISTIQILLISPTVAAPTAWKATKYNF